MRNSRQRKSLLKLNFSRKRKSDDEKEEKHLRTIKLVKLIKYRTKRITIKN